VYFLLWVLGPSKQSLPYKGYRQGRQSAYTAKNGYVNLTQNFCRIDAIQTTENTWIVLLLNNTSCINNVQSLL